MVAMASGTVLPPTEQSCRDSGGRSGHASCNPDAAAGCQPPTTATSQLGGIVYLEMRISDATYTAGEQLLPDVAVVLTGTSTSGTAINMSTTTDANGAYSFGDLPAGTYTISGHSSDRVAYRPLAGRSPGRNAWSKHGRGHNGWRRPDVVRLQLWHGAAETEIAGASTEGVTGDCGALRAGFARFPLGNGERPCVSRPWRLAIPVASCHCHGRMSPRPAYAWPFAVDLSPRLREVMCQPSGENSPHSKILKELQSTRPFWISECGEFSPLWDFGIEQLRKDSRWVAGEAPRRLPLRSTILANLGLRSASATIRSWCVEVRGWLLATRPCNKLQQFATSEKDVFSSGMSQNVPKCPMKKRLFPCASPASPPTASNCPCTKATITGRAASRSPCSIAPSCTSIPMPDSPASAKCARSGRSICRPMRTASGPASRELGPHLIGEDPLQLGKLNRTMDAALKGHAYVKSGIDMACWDMLGKATGQPVCALLGGRFGEEFMLYRAISQESPEQMAAKVAGYRAEGYTRFQLKVGGEAGSGHRAHPRGGRGAAAGRSPGGRCQHGLADARRAARRAGVRDIDVYIEQPCLTYEECLTVRRHTDHPFVLDEVIDGRGVLLRGHADRAMDVVNIKISKFGGLTKARQARDLCVSLGVAMTLEDSWGGDIVTAAIAHLAHSTPPEFLFTSTDFNSYVTKSIADGEPRRVNGGWRRAHRRGWASRRGWRCWARRSWRVMAEGGRA